MKRKLNEGDVPTPVPTQPNFEDLGLDARILQAIAAEEGFNLPTPVQAQAIPLALEGRDILARAKTGSGKTAAYVLPIIHSILQKKLVSPQRKAVSALLLMPTKELAEQVSKVVASFCAFCAKDIRTLNLAQKISDPVQRSLLADCPDIVIATPARARLNIASKALELESLMHLVVDEADLVLSYGYEEDLQNVANSMPNGVQTFLMSATLSTEVDTLKGVFCQNPAVLALDETEEEANKVSQYVVRCGEDEKFLLIYVIVKLKLIKGKSIIFVADIDRCYRLKLYLEQFGTKSCVLNSELPVNSRIHVVEEFNKGVYDIIIASDEHEVVGSGARQSTKVVMDEDEGAKASGDQAETSEAVAAPEPKRKKQKKGKRDKEYGVSRGIDFKNVACVLNFDLPLSSKSYIHRIGRTARAGKTGMALSFVVPSNLYRKHKSTTIPSAEHDEKTLTHIIESQEKKGKDVKDYAFDMAQVDAFRYRTADALRAVTRIAIREARTKELRQELIKSEKLKRHFEENPDDLHHLRHDGELRSARIQPHLRHVPEYLMPNGGAKAISGDIGFVGMGKTSENRIRKNRAQNRAKGRTKAKRSDPLKTFNARGRGKK